MAVVRKTATKVWLDGSSLKMTEPAMFEGELDASNRPGPGRWALTASIPTFGPPWRETWVAGLLEDGTVVRAWCRLAWTPDTPELAVFEGLDEREWS